MQTHFSLALSLSFSFSVCFVSPSLPSPPFSFSPSFFFAIQIPPHTDRHAQYISPNLRSSLSLRLMNPLKAGARALRNTHTHTHTHTPF